jgi:hypothetical protein
MQCADSKFEMQEWRFETTLFSLAISEGNEGFRGGWLCETCCNYEYVKEAADSFEESLEATKASAMNHHRTSHA